MDDCQCLGEYLRQQRQGKGLSLSDIASRTKVTQNYLQALEDGRYDRLPAELYIRGFLASYAESLGLSVPKIIELYRSERQEHTPEAPNIQIVATSSSASVNHSRFKPTVILLLLFIIFTCTGLWWLSAGGDQAPADAAPLLETTVEEADAPFQPLLSQPIQNDLSTLTETAAATSEAIAVDRLPTPLPVVTKSAVSAEPYRDQPLPKVGQGITFPAVMELKATAPASVAVTIDGRPLQSYTLQAGSILRWRIRKSVDLQVDPKAAVLVSLGDVEVDADKFGHFVHPSVGN